jgi:hypothetical protein
MNYKDAEYRYNEDADFRYLVDFMENMFDKLHFSPAEMKSAATYAAIRFQHRRMPTYKFEAADGTVNEIPLDEAARLEYGRRRR